MKIILQPTLSTELNYNKEHYNEIFNRERKSNNISCYNQTTKQKEVKLFKVVELKSIN